MLPLMSFILSYFTRKATKNFGQRAKKGSHTVDKRIFVQHKSLPCEREVGGIRSTTYEFAGTLCKFLHSYRGIPRS